VISLKKIKRQFIGFRISTKDKKKLVEIASILNKSISEYIRSIIEEDISKWEGR